jgi:hypothetical protein
VFFILLTWILFIMIVISLLFNFLNSFILLNLFYRLWWLFYINLCRFIDLLTILCVHLIILVIFQVVKLLRNYVLSLSEHLVFFCSVLVYMLLLLLWFGILTSCDFLRIVIDTHVYVWGKLLETAFSDRLLNSMLLVQMPGL